MLPPQTVSEELSETVQQALNDTEAKVSLWSRYFSAEQLLEFITNGVLIVLTLFFLIVSYQILKRLMRRVFHRQKRRSDALAVQELETLENLLHSALFYIFIFVAGVSVLSLLGVNMRGLIASAGVAGLAIAFISQSVIKDWITGIFIIIERQYKVGDWVTIAGHKGQVRSLGMRTTTLENPEGDLIMVPNGTIVNIINHSILPQVTYIDIPVPYESQPNRIADALERAMKQVNLQYTAQLMEEAQLLGPVMMEENVVRYRMSFASSLPDSYAISRAVHRESHKAFQAMNIPIPHLSYRVMEMSVEKEDNAHAPET